ncbi:N-acetylmuramoyl-L-alanine amidase family protein [Bartonella ancashensis]|uniref:N-acetylmuramoyl-L-alanine amidase n=1 Tax=Bartonella ancashensis TaxID=1318743 RepID=A0A0M4LT99_9HYPH|nr:N-acetylmuramoyl-L-alanine amidase [Bartonella ancashensis]ALE03797.1 N-acetylmuramoyl-L-alanine amidase [Bartonella ancashensis]
MVWCVSVTKLRASHSYLSIIQHFIHFLLFFLMYQVSVQAADSFGLVSLRAIGDNTNVRIIAAFSSEPRFHLQILDKPARLIINLPLMKKNTFIKEENVLPAMLFDMSYIFSNVRESRVIVTSKAAFSVKKSVVQKLHENLWQVLIDITQTTQQQFNAALQEQNAASQGQKQVGNITKKQPDFGNHFRVVLDPGHGGIDSGAKGVTGVLEKDVTLAFARAVRDALKKYNNINVILTRDSDVFLRLKERVQKAQRFNADLFVSIHADTINTPFLRGSTVYTLSDKASDAMAKTLAESENKVDLLGGFPTEEFSEVTDILIDLARRETHTFSINFADRIILNLSQDDIHLINNPHRYADFQVLKAPDVPSVLIEIGYLSNEEDEKLLNDSEWRKKMASSIARSIYQFSLHHQEIISFP